MPLQNRVTPFSNIEFNPARGLFTGNRGILHNQAQQLVTTRWRHKAWIVCELKFKDFQRKLMQPGHWTELFFLDEATAFAAGHRPCGFCRKLAYRKFLELSGHKSAKSLDAALHLERTQIQPATTLGKIANLTMFAIEATAYLKLNHTIVRWDHSGYSPCLIAPDQVVRPLTPPLTSNVISGGYQPVLHPSVLNL